jgi:hypothetical protein
VPISRDLLDADEELLVDVHPHWVLLLAPGLATAAAAALVLFLVAQFPHAPDPVGWFLVLLVLVPAAWFVARLVEWWSTSLVVTTSRLMLRRGILRRDVVQLRLQRIADVHCVQTIPQRLLGVGRLVIEVFGEDSMVTVDDVRQAPTLQRVLTRRLDRQASPTDVATGSGGPPVTRASGPLTAPGWADAVTGPRPGYAEVPAHPTPPVGTPVVEAPVPPDPVDVHRQLIALDDLRRRGILTEAEFVAKKTELLGRL